MGVNFLILGYAYTEGGVAFDTALPIDNPELETHSGFLAYARVLDLWGMSGKIDAVLESDVNILDVAACAVIVEAAGGRVTDLDGGPLTLASTSVLATNGRLHDAVLEAIRS